MKILQINKFYYLKGGSERYLFELSQILEKNGHAVIPFSMRDDKNQPTFYKEYFAEKVDLEKFSLKNIAKMFWNWDAAKKLEKLIQKEKPDVAHLHNYAYQISPSIIGVLRKHRIPIVQTLHDYKLTSPNYQLFCDGRVCDHGEKGKFYQCFVHRCIKNSYLKSLLAVLEAYWNNKKYQSIDLFLAPSDFMKKACVAFGIPEEKIQTLYNPIDLEKYQNNSATKKDYLLYFGRLSEEKGVDMLIEAMSQVDQKMTLKIAGDGREKEKLEKIVARLGLEERVEFVGPKFDQELINLISEAKAVVIPSIWLENMPMALLESMALKKATIISNLGGMPERIEDGKNGFIFQSGDSKDLAEKINSLDKFDLSEIGDKARDSVKNFDIKNHYQKIMEIYQKISRV